MMLKSAPGVLIPSSKHGSVPKLAAPALPQRQVVGQRGRQSSTIVASSRRDLLESRIYRRMNADHQYWEDYLTTDRYFKNILSLPKSRILSGLSVPLLSVTAISVFVCTYETLRSQGILPAEFPSILMPNNTPLQLTSFAVSLLLVFRTNQSYDRWWEARKIWGTILQRSRDIVTQSMCFIPEEEKELRLAMRNWTIAFSRALEGHLQGKLVSKDLKTNLQNTLDEKEMEMLLGSQHKVCKTLCMLSEIALQAPINSIERQMIQSNVQVFYDLLGMCERIMRTPLPLTYTRHSSRFLYFYIGALPFALYGSFGWGTVPITLVISALLMGIDEIGVQIEEPFGVLPLDAICTRCELDARSITDEQPKLAGIVKGMAPPGTPSVSRTAAVPVEARLQRGITKDLEHLMVPASKGRSATSAQQQLQASSAATATVPPPGSGPSANGNGTDHGAEGGNVNEVMHIMQAARAQVQKALQRNNSAQEGPEQQQQQHSNNGGSSVGVMEAVQLQQEQHTVAMLRADLNKAHAQLAELSQFLKEGKQGDSQAPEATQAVLGGQLANQQDEIAKLRASLDLMRGEANALRAQMANAQNDTAHLHAMQAQLVAREMVVVRLENEVRDLQQSLYDFKVSLSKGLGIPLIGYKWK